MGGILTEIISLLVGLVAGAGLTLWGMDLRRALRGRGKTSAARRSQVKVTLLAFCTEQYRSAFIDLLDESKLSDPDEVHREFEAHFKVIADKFCQRAFDLDKRVGSGELSEYAAESLARFIETTWDDIGKPNLQKDEIERFGAFKDPQELSEHKRNVLKYIDRGERVDYRSPLAIAPNRVNKFLRSIFSGREITKLKHAEAIASPFAEFKEIILASSDDIYTTISK